jgi:excisionase family DNA binding protein
MPRYPKQPLEERLAWMRERQRNKADEQPQAQKKAKEDTQVAAGAVTTPTEAMRDLLQTRMLRVNQVAEILSVSHMTVRRWFADRAVIAHPGARRTTMLIPVEALDGWFREHAPKAKKVKEDGQRPE